MNAKEPFDHWTSVRRGLNKALDKLTDEQLDFVARDANSFPPAEGSRAVGQRPHPGTWGPGVDVSTDLVYHRTWMDKFWQPKAVAPFGQLTLALLPLSSQE